MAVGPVRVAELAREIGDNRQKVRALLASANFSIWTGKIQQWLSDAEAAIALADTPELRQELSVAYQLAGWAHHRMADFSDAQTCFDRAEELFDPQSQSTASLFTMVDAGVQSRALRALTLWELGYQDQAKVLAEETIRLAEGRSHPVSIAFVQAIASSVFSRRGETRRALEVAESLSARSMDTSLISL